MENQQFNMEYVDVIQYLNQLTTNRKYGYNYNHDYYFMESEELTNQDLEICRNTINKIINIINETIENNQFNKLSTNISSFDGFEKVQKELGLAPSLYPKYSYNSLISLVGFKINNVYYYNKNLKFNVNFIIKRDKQENGLNNYHMKVKIIFLIMNNMIIVENVFILGFIKKENEQNYFYSNNKMEFKNLNDKYSINEMNEIREKQNLIMQTTVENNVIDNQNIEDSLYYL